MSRFFAFLAPLFMLGAAHAAEVADAPLPEPNYVGIIVFLVISVGSCVWFFWKMLRDHDKAKQEESK